MSEAPGWPGNPARWTSSAKSGLGVALSESSRVWFTISHGIINEVYYPRVDQACLRDLGLIVTDGENFFAEEKRECEFEVAQLEDGVPAYELTSTHREGRFRIIKHVIADPRSDSVLMRARLEVLTGRPLRLFALAAPHLVNRGAHNSAWRGDYKGASLPFASGDGTALAMASNAPFAAISVGFVGVSDGWRQLSHDKRLVDQYDQARDGNVALTVELSLDETGTAVLSLGFGTTPAEAAFHAVTSVQTPFDTIFDDYASGWRAWQAGLRSMERRSKGHNLYRVSTAVLRSHETPTFPGGFIASLSIPWGSSKGDDDLGGYHLVWPRDLCETAGAFLACGAFGPVRRILRYLRATQEAQGSWSQNCWLDGTPYWAGMQLDECAFPLLLLDMALREGAIKLPDIRPYWPMVKAAAGFVLRNGPRTRQDRWEENGGFTPFTLAVAIAGLLGAAEIAQMLEEHKLAELFRDTADAWNEQIEDWVYVTGGSLDKQLGVAGHYIRIAPVNPETGAPDVHAKVQVRNHEVGAGVIEADALVSTDALALVRFGLRAADDPRVLDTIKSSTSSSRSSFRKGRAGGATISTATARRRTEAPSTERASGASGRCSPASARITNSPRAAGRRRNPSCRQSRRRPARADSFPSRSGTRPQCRSASSRPASPPARRCRWSGRIRNISSCCAR
jgi:glucoamylase